MLSITTLDLICLDSDHAARNDMVHARAAERLAGTAFTARLAVVVLLAAAAASLALVVFAIYATIGFEARVSAHRLMAHRVWLVAERFRALIAEINDGRLDPPQALRRRDELMHDLPAIYEQAFGADQPAHEPARLPPLQANRAA